MSNRADGILRLKHLREQTEAVGAEMDNQRGRFAALADPSAAPRAVSAFNLFQTPQALAARLARLAVAGLSPAGVVLEPSAGLGRLYRAIRDAGHAGPMVLVEQSPDLCRELYGMTAGDSATLRQGDFLGMDCGPVDAVIMNPPFKMGRDVKHIKHAFAMLKPGGLLVSLCYDGVKQNAGLRPWADTWEPLPVDTFREAGTRAAVVLLTKRKR